MAGSRRDWIYLGADSFDSDLSFYYEMDTVTALFIDSRDIDSRVILFHHGNV